MKTSKKLLLIFLLFFTGLKMNSQNSDKVNWISFEQLYDSLQQQPRKVFIDFYADWCAPCKRMDAEVFSKTEIQNILNNKYYAVKMDVESADTIYFGKQTFVNERLNRRNPVHQIALLMARRKNKAFSLPAIVILNEDFNARARYFQYLNAEQLKDILTTE